MRKILDSQNFDLDKIVSLSVVFSEDRNYAGEPLRTMKFHIADDDNGLYWYPNKKAIGNLIQALKKVESQMTDDTNFADIEDEDD